MSIFRWIAKEPTREYSMRLWVLAFMLVCAVWAVIPLVLDVLPSWGYFAIPLSPRNLVKILSISFGEELVFRTLPILIVLSLFPKRILIAVGAGIVAAYYFGMWHDYVFVQNLCLSVGGVILVFVYLKFGGASGNPFKGFIACGSIHGTYNISVIALANAALW